MFRERERERERESEWVNVSRPLVFFHPLCRYNTGGLMHGVQTSVKQRKRQNYHLFHGKQQLYAGDKHLNGLNWISRQSVTRLFNAISRLIIIVFIILLMQWYKQFYAQSGYAPSYCFAWRDFNAGGFILLGFQVSFSFREEVWWKSMFLSLDMFRSRSYLKKKSRHLNCPLLLISFQCISLSYL